MIRILLLLLISISSANANDEIKDAALKLGSHYIKGHIEQYVDFNNPYIKYTGGTIGVITKKEIDIKLNNNTKLKIEENGIFIRFKKSF